MPSKRLPVTTWNNTVERENNYKTMLTHTAQQLYNTGTSDETKKKTRCQQFLLAMLRDLLSHDQIRIYWWIKTSSFFRTCRGDSPGASHLLPLNPPVTDCLALSYKTFHYAAIKLALTSYATMGSDVRQSLLHSTCSSCLWTRAHAWMSYGTLGGRRTLKARPDAEHSPHKIRYIFPPTVRNLQRMHPIVLAYLFPLFSVETQQFKLLIYIACVNWIYWDIIVLHVSARRVIIR
jgi:hypothetical protein